jgi:hypothetical protein
VTHQPRSTQNFGQLHAPTSFPRDVSLKNSGAASLARTSREITGGPDGTGGRKRFRSDNGQHHFWSPHTIFDIHHPKNAGAGARRLPLGIQIYAEVDDVRGVYRVQVQFEVAETMEQVFMGLRLKFY